MFGSPMASMTTSTEKNPSPFGQQAIFDWIARWRDAARTAPWASLVELDGIDLVDVLTAPIFLAVLDVTRGRGNAGDSPVIALGSRARQWAYEARERMIERLAARRSAPAEPADVVLWAREVTHVAVFRQVSVALRELGTSCRLLACQAKVFEMLRRDDPTAVLAYAAWPAAIREARRHGRRRAAQLAAHGRWKMPPLGTLSPDALEQAVRSTITQFLPRAAETIATAKAAIDSLRPKALVVGNDLTIEGRAACRVAARREVPTAVFMHGSIAAEPLQALHCADRMLVYGPIHQEQLIGQGLAPEQVAVCGATHLDRVPRQSGATHPLLCQKLGLAAGKPWVLVATSGPGHSISHAHHERVIDAVCRLAAALGDVPIVVKLHRKDRLEYYHPRVERSGAKNLHVVADASVAAGYPATIFDWLQGCSVVLTGASTVALEAMVMDVPVITMDFADEIRGVDFIDAGATTHVRTGDELVAAVRAVLQRPGHEDALVERVRLYLARAFHALDGRSAERGAQSIRQLIASRDVR